MVEGKVSIRTRLWNLWVKILEILHLVPLSMFRQVNADCCDLEGAKLDLEDQCSRYNAKITRLEDQLEDLMATKESLLEAQADYEFNISGFQTHINELYSELGIKDDQIQALLKRVDDLQEKVYRYEDGSKQISEYNEAVMKQLQGVLANDPSFQFPNNIPMAGSICYDIRKEDEADPCCTVSGRAILLDNVGKELDAAPDLATSYETILLNLKKYGTLNNIMMSLIKNGCMAMTLTYNGNSQLYEVYYRMTANSVHKDATFVIGDRIRGQAVPVDPEDLK